MVNLSKMKGEVMTLCRPIPPARLSSQLREQLQAEERSRSVPQALAQAARIIYLTCPQRLYQVLS